MKTSLLLPLLTLLSPCSGFRWIVPGSDGGDHGESVETEGQMADLNKEGSCCEYHNFYRVTINYQRQSSQCDNVPWLL